MEPIADTQRLLRLSDSVVMTELNGEAILLDLRAEMYYGLDELGTRIWGLLAEGFTVEQIMSRLLAEYEVTPPELHHDLWTFVGLLVEKQLVTVEGA